MIKKTVWLLMSIFLLQLQGSAIENGSVLNLKTGTSYIIPLQSRPMNVKVTNSDIVRVDSVTCIEEKDSSLLITTYNEGISYITFNTKKDEIKIKLLIDNLAQEDENLLKLDVLKEYNRQ